MWRIKTEEELIAEFGEDFRKHGCLRGLTWVKSKDAIFGLEITDHEYHILKLYRDKGINLKDKLDSINPALRQGPTAPWTVPEEFIEEESEIEF